MKKIFFIFLATGLLAAGYWLISPAFRVIERNESAPRSQEMPQSRPTILAEGVFLPHAHGVKGKAILIENEGKRYLRFEDFYTINGPDLRIYLSRDLKADDFIDLGPIKATKGNVNYALSRNIDISKYRYVLVWCRAFGVLFSSAQLNSL